MGLDFFEAIGGGYSNEGAWNVGITERLHLGLRQHLPDALIPNFQFEIG